MYDDEDDEEYRPDQDDDDEDQDSDDSEDEYSDDDENGGSSAEACSGRGASLGITTNVLSSPSVSSSSGSTANAFSLMMNQPQSASLSRPRKIARRSWQYGPVSVPRDPRGGYARLARDAVS